MYIYMYLGNYRDKCIYSGLRFLQTRKNVQGQTSFNAKFFLETVS